MKTAHDTFTTWDDDGMAAGFDETPSGPRRTAMARRPEERFLPADRDNVIDLSAWRAAEPDEPDWDDGAPDEPELVLPAARPRRDHRRALLAAELASTLCVAAAAMVLIVRVLTF